ncbi:hypothetical protein Bca4012_061001 [Brassica carinata]
MVTFILDSSDVILSGRKVATETATKDLCLISSDDSLSSYDFSADAPVFQAPTGIVGRDDSAFFRLENLSPLLRLWYQIGLIDGVIVGAGTPNRFPCNIVRFPQLSVLLVIESK